MKRIEREYAIIYVDEYAESLTHEHFTPEFIIDDYYKCSGFLQWNVYLIIPKELVLIEKEKEILKDEFYTRKFVVESEKIDSFIDELFPVLTEVHGKIKLIKGNSWKEATSLALVETAKDGGVLTPSWYRDNNLTFSLTEMDKLRAKLINNELRRAVFFTNISNEFYLAEKKFNLLLDLS